MRTPEEITKRIDRLRHRVSHLRAERARVETRTRNRALVALGSALVAGFEPESKLTCTDSIPLQICRECNTLLHIVGPDKLSALLVAEIQRHPGELEKWKRVWQSEDADDNINDESEELIPPVLDPSVES